MNDDDVVDRVAWAIHAWSCPLCQEGGMQAMAESGQAHVMDQDRLMAAFMFGALGLTPVDREETTRP